MRYATGVTKYAKRGFIRVGETKTAIGLRSEPWDRWIACLSIHSAICMDVARAT